jgi:hypothetical protein
MDEVRKGRLRGEREALRKFFSGNTVRLPRVTSESVINYFVVAATELLARPKQQNTRSKCRCSK